MKVISLFKLQYATILTLMAGTLGASITPAALAEVPEVNPQQPNLSYQAEDLQFKSISSELAQTPIDLNQFCRDYPFNSRCTYNVPPTTTPIPIQIQIQVQPPEQARETPTREGSGWALTPEVSTLGIGGSITRSITPNFNARVGLNALRAGVDITETDVTYDADVNLSNISTLIDFHPFRKSGFRLTGGLVFQDNNFEGTATNNGTITIGGVPYSRQAIESVNAKLSFGNSAAPYLGIGWGNAVKPSKRWGFSWNLGVMFTGAPEITVTPTYGPEGNDNVLRTQIDSSIQQETQELEDDLERYNIYPVLSLGISYQF